MSIWKLIICLDPLLRDCSRLYRVTIKQQELKGKQRVRLKCNPAKHTSRKHSCFYTIPHSGLLSFWFVLLSAPIRRGLSPPTLWAAALASPAGIACI